MVAAFFKHQIFALLAGPVLALVLVLPVDAFIGEFRGSIKDAVETLVEIMVIVGTLAVGFVIPKNADEDRNMAIWAWILPLVFLCVAFAWDASYFGVKKMAMAYFAADPPSGDGLAFILFTFPVISAVSYSLGAYVSVRRLRRR